MTTFSTHHYSAAVILLLSLSFLVQTKEGVKGGTSKSRQGDKKNVLLSTDNIGPPNIPSSIGINTHSKSEFYSGRKPQKLDGRLHCISEADVECSELDADCLECNFDVVKENCTYGSNVTVKCNVTESADCKGKRFEFQKEIICQYCYQTPQWQQRCNGASLCNSVGAPKYYFRANCTVAPDVLCLGNRQFSRMMPCNWKNGYRWSTTFFLSVTLGGFGADRFYLGRWQEGIGKLFSFGGLGLWTFVDIILIGVRYLGPADGSLYVD